MAVTNAQSGTSLDEIADGIFRISTPLEIPGGVGFSFNQYLVVDDEPLLYHTGPRRMFELVREAVASVLPVQRLRWIAWSHFEQDECGSLNEWLAAAPASTPVCGRIGAMTSIGDLADRAPRALADGETIALGTHLLRWFDTPHLPHGWDCGLLHDETTGTMFCGDLFTQPGAKHTAVVETDILAPSEAFRRSLDYFAHAADSAAQLERLAAAAPRTMACMHGSAWRGDGAALLRGLSQSLAG
jgi:flavorubredoxin